jgi:hypothetical protein
MSQSGGRFGGRGHGGRGAPTENKSASQGMTPEIGYVLKADRGKPNPAGVAQFNKKLSIYLMLHFKVADVEQTVSLTAPKWPSIPDEPDPVYKKLSDIPEPVATRGASASSGSDEEAAKAKLEERKDSMRQQNTVIEQKWKDNLKRTTDKQEIANASKTQVYAAIYGNLDSGSVDLIKSSTAGAAAIAAKDPAGLWKAILATHLISNQRSESGNFFDASINFNAMRHQGNEETLIDLNERVDIALAALTESAKKTVPAQTAAVPTELYITQLFVEKLMNKKKYGLFIGEWKRQPEGHKDRATRQAAIDAAALYGEGSAPNFGAAPTSYAAVASQEWNNGGRGGGRNNRGRGGRTNGGRGGGRSGGRRSYHVVLKGACSRCHKMEHVVRDCKDTECCSGCALEGCKDSVQARRDVNRSYMELRNQEN